MTEEHFMRYFPMNQMRDVYAQVDATLFERPEWKWQTICALRDSLCGYMRQWPPFLPITLV